MMCFQKEVHPIVDDVLRRHKKHKVVSGKSKQATDISETLIHSKHLLVWVLFRKTEGL